MILRPITRTITQPKIIYKRFPRIQFTSSPKQKPDTESTKNSLSKLRIPAIFGMGLYLGLVVLGGGEKEEPAIFTEMKWRMIGGDKR